jgi:hypothetical protein
VARAMVTMVVKALKSEANIESLAIWHDVKREGKEASLIGAIGFIELIMELDTPKFELKECTLWILKRS